MAPIAANQIESKPVKQEALPTDPTLSTGEGIFYAKEVNSIVEAFFKNGAGQVIQLTENGQVLAGGGLDKNLKNESGSSIPPNKPVSITANGSIVLSDSDAAGATKPIGISRETIVNNASGRVSLFGRNIPGALTGLGFTPGDDIFMDEVAGALTNDVSGFSGDDDHIVRLGVAAMPDGQVGSAATDLIIIREVIASP